MTVRLARIRALTIATTSALVVAASAGLVSASAAPLTVNSASVPSAASPTVDPITGGLGAIVPANLNLLDLGKVGYQSAEYRLSGTASAYTGSSPLPSDGKWTVTPTSPASYKTRIVVFRPSNPAKFNGTVVVEWLNVSGQVDANPDWTQTHNELIREGAVWVGVSAQQVGVNQLQCPTTLPNPPVAPCFVAPGDPARYGSLLHPGDRYSYDIFSQAGQAIRDKYATVLGGLKPSTLLAAGESQSAGRMVTYIDAIQPLVHEYDGFLVHSRGAGGAALAQSPQTSVVTTSPTFIRTDLDVPVFVFQTETDIAGAFTARQADTNVFRQWEAAGTSHFDTYGLLIGPTDTGNGQGAVANLEAMQHPSTSPGPGAECSLPINTGGAHWLLNSAIYWLNQWVTKGSLPPIGQPLQIANPPTAAFYAKDANGNTLGGVRTPQVDAPIAALGGIGNSPAPGNTSPIAAFCRLFGSTVPFTPAQLSSLYKNHGQFVSAWGQATKSLVKDGFILAADENELTQSAVHSAIGK